MYTSLRSSEAASFEQRDSRLKAILRALRLSTVFVAAVATAQSIPNMFPLLNAGTL